MDRPTMLRRALLAACALAAVAAPAVAPGAAAAALPATLPAVAPAAKPSRSALSVAAQLTPQGYVSVSGRLVDGTGAPIAGAAIGLLFDGVSFATTVTGADGSFQQLADPGGTTLDGAHTFTAVFAGDHNHEGSQASTTLAITVPTSAPPTVVPTDTAAPEPTTAPTTSTSAPPPPTTVAATSTLTAQTGAPWRGRTAVTFTGTLTSANGPITGARVAVGVDNAAGADATAITTNDGSFQVIVTMPDVPADKPMTLVFHFDGGGGFPAARFDLPGTVLPWATPTPTPTTAPPTPAAPSPKTTPSATPTPVAAPPSIELPPATDALKPLLWTMAAALAGLVLVGVAAYAWHRRDLGSRG